MRSTKLLAAAAAAVALTALTVPAPASAATPGCVTSREFAKVRKGWSKAKVHRAFGTRGKRAAFARAGRFTSEVRSYRTCTRYGAVAVSYSNGRLAAKSAVF